MSERRLRAEDERLGLVTADSEADGPVQLGLLGTPNDAPEADR